MNMLKEEIVLLCRDFIKAADNLYENGQITYEEYVQMTKLKQEYINHMERLKQHNELF